MTITRKDLEMQLSALNRVSERKYTLSYQNGQTVLYRMDKANTAPTLAVAIGTKGRVSEIMFAMVDAIVYSKEE